MRILLFIMLVFIVDFIYLRPASTEPVKQSAKQVKHDVKIATIDCKHTMQIFHKASCDNDKELREVIQEKINNADLKKGSIVEITEVIPIMQGGIRIGYLLKIHYNYLE